MPPFRRAGYRCAIDKEGKMKKLLTVLLSIALILSLGLAGCAGVTDVVVPMGQDTFMIACHGTMGWSSAGAQKAKAFQQADEYCKKLGKQLQVINTTETPSGFGKIASAEVQFRCLMPGDPELGRPTLQPVR